MSKQILVRNISKEVGEWIEQERHQYNMTQQEFILSTLNKAHVATPKNERMFPKPTNNPQFTFIDLFAGIGGVRIAFEKLGGECIFTSEWDKYAQKTYKAWFGEMPAGDIRKIKPADIPNHDILAAGFPCQPFSIAGVSKKKSLGMAHGFKDKNQGNLFFYLATIIEAKRPPIIFLENVKNLKSHDGGRTWEVITKKLEELNYSIFHKIYDGAHWVPQHRERVFIVGFNKKIFGNSPEFTFPEPPKDKKPKLRDILEKAPKEKYTLTKHLWEYLQDYARRHQEKGNGFGFGIADPDGITRTLSARYYKDGSEILIAQKNKQPRRLSPQECVRLMGFPEQCKVVVSDTQAYRQFGNAVVVPAVETAGKEVVKMLLSKKRQGKQPLNGYDFSNLRKSNKRSTSKRERAFEVHITK